jgi:CRP/FNR family transcriptional regulator, anaerobic regulatory protein
MISVIEQLAKLFPLSSDAKAVQSLASVASVSAAAAGAKLFASGDVCENFVIIESGQARVQLSTKAGRNVTLFRLQPGQSCALTTSCLLSESPYYAEGIAETGVKLITIPSSAFREALQASPDMMRFLLADYAGRIAEMTALVDRLTSRDLSADLAEFLLIKADRSQTISLSHKSIANELGTAREVVSRKLKDWEKQTWVELHRGTLKVLNREALGRLSR